MSHILGKYDLDAVLEDVSYQGTDFVGKLIETWVYNQLMPEIDLQPMWQMSQKNTPMKATWKSFKSF